MMLIPPNMEEDLLQMFRAKIPFLNLIPESIHRNLGTSEFYLPDNSINQIRENLEDALGHYVMTYKRNMFDLSIRHEQHLCGNIKGAILSDYQKRMLQEYEDISINYGVSFVVYQKPLEIIKVKESELYTYYQQRNLI